MLRIGLIGLPNAGKTTLFNFLCNASALTANYPFTTITPNKAPYVFFDYPTMIFASKLEAKSIQWDEVEIWDIAGLIENAHKGEGLGNEFLSQIKDTDCLVHTIRYDQNSTDVNVLQNFNTINNELALYDHALLLKPFEKARRLKNLYPNNPTYSRTDDLLTRIYTKTKEGEHTQNIVSDSELDEIKYIGLLSPKPQLKIINGIEKLDDAITIALGAPSIQVNVLEISAVKDLSLSEQIDLGYTRAYYEDFLNDFSKNVLRLLKLKVFYTVGDLGVGQWVVPMDSNAIDCAKRLHEELGDKLKQVRVCKYDDFTAFKSWRSALHNGKVRMYAPSYKPNNNEVLYFETK